MRLRSATAWLCIALAALFLQALADPAAAACTDFSASRSIPAASLHDGFGRAQALPAPPLKAGEYAITIDDGPSPVTTRKYLDILSGECVPATFFLVGRNALAHPELVQAILDGGHRIGNHSMTHADLGKLDLAGIMDELRSGAAAIRKAAGRDVDLSLTRLPGSAGFKSQWPRPIVDAMIAEKMIPAGLDYSPQDWRNSPPEQSFKLLFGSIGDRGVILFHDGQPNTIKLLPMVIEELKRRGATFVRLGDG